MNAPAAGRTAAFFDVDNTIVRGPTLLYLAIILIRHGILTPKHIRRYGRALAQYNLVGESIKSLEDVEAEALSLVRGREVTELVALGEDAYDAIIESRIWPATRALIDSHRDEGHEVWFVSATPHEVANVIARRLGATGALATNIEHVDGFYTGRCPEGPMHAARKGVAIGELARERGLDLASSFAYGDSRNDLWMLREVGHPRAVNPDKQLQRTAKHNGWPITELRRRRALASPRVRWAAAATGTLWLMRKVVRGRKAARPAV